MARLLSESFERGDLYQFDSATGNAQIKTVQSTYPVPNGIRYLELASSGNNVTKSVSGTEFYIGFYVLFQVTTQAATFFRWFNGATELGSIRTNALGQLEAYTGAGAGTLKAAGVTVLQAGNPTHTLYHIQVHVKLDDAVGTIQVRLNDVSVPLEIDFNGDTKPGAETTITSFQWIAAVGAGFYYYDNIIINDTTTASDNTWPGIVKFDTMLTTGNGFYFGNWTKNSGSAADYTYVDDNPNDGDTTYLFTTVTNTYASFSMADQALANVTYKALLTHAIARKDGGTAKLAVGIRDNDNNVNYVSGLKDLGVSYGIVTERRLTDPSTGIAWDSAGINATEALIISTA